MPVRTSTGRLQRALTLLAVLFGCWTGAAPAAESAGKADTDAKALTLVAELALQRGNCFEAADAYARAAATTGDSQLAKRATEVGIGCEQWPRALQSVTRWRALAPQDPEVARTAGLVALKLRHLAEARTAFDVMLGLSGKDTERALIELVPLASQTADPVSAFAVLKDFAADPNLGAGALTSFAALAFDADNYGAARGYIDRATKIDPKAAQPAALRVKIQAAQGEDGGAIAAARDLSRSGAEGQKFVLAETLADLDRQEEARVELERLQKSEDTRVEAERRLALLAFRGGDFTEARRRFEQIYGRREGSTEALYYLSLLAEIGGDTDAALSGYEQLAGSDAGALARVRAASVLMRAGDRERALAVLDDAANGSAGRTVIDAAVEKSQVLSTFGAPGEALKILDEALVRFPGHPQLLYERATVLERAGRVHDSVLAFESMLKDRPQDSLIENALGYTLADHRLDLPRAEELIRRALTASPDSAAVVDSLGWVRFRRGDFAQALPLLERAYHVGRDAEIAAHWGEALWAAGRQGEARSVWARALALSPQSEPLKAVIARFEPRTAADGPAEHSTAPAHKP